MAISSPPSRSAGGGPALPAGREPFVYSCNCRGFRENNPIHFCVRCLSVWVDGLPAVMSGKRLERAMRQAAGILARRLKEDPSLGRMLLNDALDASEHPPR